LRLILKERYGSVSSGPFYEEAIYYAARAGHEHIVWFLIDRGILLSGVLHVKSMVMLEGAKAGRVGMVQMMLDHGIDIEFQGQTSSAYCTAKK
jgi:hypothetical protein